jgi:hypothetical protein
MTEYGRVAALSWAERLLLVETAVICVLVRFGLRTLSFRRLRRWVIRLADRATGSEDQIETTDVEWAVGVTSTVLPGKTTCLVNALTATAVCRRHGLPAELRVGVTTDDEFAAHAWVAVNGEVIGTTAPRYTPLPLDEAI